MLTLALSERVEQLRKELRSWLAANPPPCASAEGDPGLEEFQARGRAWQRTLAAGRWLGVHWPENYGGRGLSLVEEAVVQEELARAGAPQVLGLFGLTMVGPVLIEHGTAEQKTRFLRKILSGEEIWCQGFSEPGAGSDLAAVSTVGENAANGGLLLTGQKVWTSFAHIANYCFVLCRTEPGSTRHQGLTYVLVDMRAAGITVRPLQQISGDKEFNEVFFDKTPVPADMIVGRRGEGWKIAISTLMYERVVLTFARHIQSEVALQEILARKDSLTAAQREHLAHLVAQACGVRALAYSHLLSYSEGAKPGPEGSLDKLLWSEHFQQVTSFALETARAVAFEGEHAPLSHNYLYSRGRTIAAGTSEIQRSIIAERLLGLPRA